MQTSSSQTATTQTTTAPSEILLRLPENLRVALGSYMAQQQDSIETIIEQAIANFLDDQQQPTIVEGEVVEEEDPAVLAFLRFLEKDITEHPERLQSFSAEWVKSALESVKGIEVDMNEALPDDDDE